MQPEVPQAKVIRARSGEGAMLRVHWQYELGVPSLPYLRLSAQWSMKTPSSCLCPLLTPSLSSSSALWSSTTSDHETLRRALRQAVPALDWPLTAVPDARRLLSQLESPFHPASSLCGCSWQTALESIVVAASDKHHQVPYRVQVCKFAKVASHKRTRARNVSTTAHSSSNPAVAPQRHQGPDCVSRPSSRAIAKSPLNVQQELRSDFFLLQPGIGPFATAL